MFTLNEFLVPLFCRDMYHPYTSAPPHPLSHRDVIDPCCKVIISTIVFRRAMITGEPLHSYTSGGGRGCVCPSVIIM